MKTAIYASLMHCSSTDKKPMHGKCPEGESSWCFYKRAIAKGETPGSHSSMKTYLLPQVVEKIMPVYQRLASDTILEKCVAGKTQNSNESLHSCIWRKCPKEVFVSKRRLEIAVTDAIEKHNLGYVKSLEAKEDSSLITERLKYRVPAEVREHFLDDWIKLKTPYKLSEKLDEYESIKQSFRREIPKKISYKSQGGANYSDARPKETPKEFKTQCDKLKKNYETVASNETVRNGTDVLAPYTSLGTVNGIEMPILRDTGATLDLICKKYVKPSMFINETEWIRTPLEETAVCLPMAEVELDCVFGHVITKAAVLRDSLDQGKYLLGNKTAALFEEVKKNKEIQMYMVKAVETRSQKKLTEESKQDLNTSEETIPESSEKNKESPDELDDILPLIQPKISESNLIKLSQRFCKGTNEQC
ncbi:SCAN box domain-containing protein [Trichonephila clavipes]|nr:SCAN box domain-containing protein [Trichonephila clavipes]